MSYLSLLIDVCTVRRYPAGGVQDDYGNPAEAWAVHLPDEPCRLNAGVGRELKIGAELVIADYKLFVQDVDITEQDRVIISGNTYEVLLVENYQHSTADHHKQCWLRITR